MNHRRPLRAQAVHDLWREQPGLYRGHLVDVGTALTIGVLLILGGRDRTQAPAWDVVNANGGPVVWGLVFLLAGVGLAFAALRSLPVITWTLRMVAALYVVLALSFLVSVLRDPTSGGSFVGSVLVARAAFMHLSRGQAYLEGPQWTE